MMEMRRRVDIVCGNLYVELRDRNNVKTRLRYHFQRLRMRVHQSRFETVFGPFFENGHQNMLFSRSYPVPEPETVTFPSQFHIGNFFVKVLYRWRFREGSIPDSSPQTIRHLQ